MTTLDLPALDGRKPLGFLAALGLTRLLTVRDDSPARLSWSPGSSSALLDSEHNTVDEIVGRLEAIIDSIPAEGVLPGVPVHFPPPGAAPDGLRLPPRDLRSLVNRLSVNPELPYRELDAWISSLVTDLCCDEKGRSAISLMAAPSGKQSMRTMLEKPLSAVRFDRKVLHEALTEWRRYPGVTGEYLDHQVLFDAVDSGSGQSEERGVPGATWLALMAYPLLRTTAQGSDPVTTGWYREGGRPPRFVWPLWSRPLDCHAIVALLEHPTLSQCANGLPISGMAGLSVFSIYSAQRRRIAGRTFAGVLGPIP